MPIIKGAIKTLRKEKRNAVHNQKGRDLLKVSLKNFKALPQEDNLSSAFSALDKAVKRGLIKAGKAARLKSRFSRTVKTSPKKTSSPVKKQAKKAK